jgi:hypothetical protein
MNSAIPHPSVGNCWNCKKIIDMRKIGYVVATTASASRIWRVGEVWKLRVDLGLSDAGDQYKKEREK